MKTLLLRAFECSNKKLSLLGNGKTLVRLLNTLWLLANLTNYFRMKISLGRPSQVQKKKLFKILKKNQATEFGREYDFANITTIEEFQRLVPINDYDDLRSRIDKIKDGEDKVLTNDTVTHLMPSSGSSAARKLIPYTDALQKDFDIAIGAWIVDLYSNKPDLLKGVAYWSISPQNTETEKSEVAIGYEQDTAYLGGWKQRLINNVMAVNSTVSEIQDLNSFRYVTLLGLVRHRNLRLISIWHPSFLILLLSGLPKFWDTIIHDIGHGTISAPKSLSRNLLDQLKFEPDEKRKIELRKLDSLDWAAIWPDLAVISCWGAGHSKGSIEELSSYFPDVEVQPKGLISTEAFISLPVANSGHGKRWIHPLAIQSNFFEFMDTMGKIHLAHELEVGREYEIIVTTSGGLYRYRMKDRVVVTGYLKKTPCIEFIGKIDSVSDYFGEKLSDEFVARQIAEICQQNDLAPTFSMLAPEEEGKSLFYCLYFETQQKLPVNFSSQLDKLLQENPHYALCRRLGQLGDARVFSISTSANRDYLLAKNNSDKKLGEIKPVKLSNLVGWSSEFSGSYVK